MPSLKLTLSIAVILAGSSMGTLASAQVETLEKVETLSGDAPRSRPTARGPITAIRPAALWIATLDTDQDYTITRAEYEAGLKATFERLDTNKDTRLSLFDIEDWRKSALGSIDAAPHALQFDNDYNSTITRAEFEATMISIFIGSDKNKDKVITFDELVTVVERPNRRSDNETERPRQQGQRGGQQRRR